MNASIFSFLKRCIAKLTQTAKPPNEITPSLMVSKLYIFQQRNKEHAAERKPGNKKKATP